MRHNVSIFLNRIPFASSEIGEVEVGAYSEETHQLLGVMNMNKWTYRIYQITLKKKRIEYCHKILRRNMACGYTIP